MEEENSHTSRSKNWERETVEKLAFAALNEQRRARRWRIFFLLLFFVYLFGLPVILSNGIDLSEVESDGRHTALVELEGVISADSEASADKIVTALRKAFKDKDTAGVILRINSPGGSPVQSSYIYREIKRLREKYPDIPLYAVITDLCASGCYYVAVGADKIYANESSIVGSIGVIMNGFGFQEAIKKLGIERRALTAGKSKALLDPFSPLKEEETKHIQGLLDEVHTQFINTVKEGRDGKLTGQDDELFNGLIWTGKKARELGLIDDFASAGQVARNIIGEEDIVDYTAKKELIDRLSEKFGVSVLNALGKFW